MIWLVPADRDPGHTNSNSTNAMEVPCTIYLSSTAKEGSRTINITLPIKEVVIVGPIYGASSVEDEMFKNSRRLVFETAMCFDFE